MTFKGTALAIAPLLAAALAGCVGERGAAPLELSSTEVFEVTPVNGVWDSEYGRTDDSRNCSFFFRVIRYADGIGVKATVYDDRVITDDCPPDSISCPSWDDDTLQCFFDGDNDKSHDARAGTGLYYGGEFTMVANGATQSDYSGCPKSHGTLWKGFVDRVELPHGGARLFYDMWFSWRCIGRTTPPAPDESVTFGFNICVHDDDDGGRCDRALYWKGNPVMPYRDESAFGTITLEGRAPEPEKRWRWTW